MRVPRPVRDLVGRERVLTFTRDADGRLVIVTPRALYLPDGPGRLPWDRVLHASWDAPSLLLTLQPEPGLPAYELRLALPAPGSVPAVLRELVTASVVGETHVELAGGRGVRLVARRTEEGTVRWSVVFDAGLDPADPELRGRADAALAEVRAAWGV